MTLYLKYRPQRVSELDSKLVRETLGKILASGKLPHAFLFCGSRGIGKTSSARIVAKAINCLQPVKGESCNTCSMCVSISSGSAPDVMEIDAASNRGIDEIRQLRDRVNLAPLEAKYKVYIIDEVHMLTIEAANALLKTLEEPPAKTIFILCTTDPERLPETVVSRCTVVKLGKPTVEELVVKLTRVASEEKIDISADDLKLVATEAKGSFRDAIKLLEQVMMNGGNVAEVLGMVKGLEPGEFLKLVMQHKPDEALAFIQQLQDQGVPIKGFVERIALLVHERLVEEVAKKGTRVKMLVKLAKQIGEVYEQLKFSAVPMLPLEVWVVENSIPVEEVKAVTVETPKAVVKESFSVVKVAVGEIPKVEKEAIKEKVAKEQVVEPITPTGAAVIDLKTLEDKWREALKVVKAKNNSVEALLRSTRPKVFDGRKFEIEVFYQFHKDKLESEKCRLLVESALSEVIGGDVKLGLVLAATGKPKEENITGNVEPDIVAAAQEIFKIQAI